MKEIVPNGIPNPERRLFSRLKKYLLREAFRPGIDLSFHIVELLHGKAAVEDTANYLEYRLHEPTS
jgi:hypothetical protein